MAMEARRSPSRDTALSCFGLSYLLAQFEQRTVRLKDACNCQEAIMICLGLVQEIEDRV